MFETWLAELRRLRKGGIRLPAISRGRPFAQQFTLKGDWTGASFRAAVKIAPDAPDPPLASFTATLDPYDAATDTTTLTLSLAGGTGANATGSLPADQDGNWTVDFVFDVLMTPSGGQEGLLVGGAVPVIGRVTQ